MEYIKPGALVVLPTRDERADDQRVHTGSKKTIDSLLRSIHDGLILIERSIDKNWKPRYFFKGTEHPPLPGIRVLFYGLETSRPIFVGYCRKLRTHLLTDTVGLNHKR